MFFFNLPYLPQSPFVLYQSVKFKFQSVRFKFKFSHSQSSSSSSSSNEKSLIRQISSFFSLRGIELTPKARNLKKAGSGGDKKVYVKCVEEVLNSLTPVGVSKTRPRPYRHSE